MRKILDSSMKNGAYCHMTADEQQVERKNNEESCSS